jgi:hypothetical protein
LYRQSLRENHHSHYLETKSVDVYRPLIEVVAQLMVNGFKIFCSFTRPSAGASGAVGAPSKCISGWLRRIARLLGLAVQ